MSDPAAPAPPPLSSGTFASPARPSIIGWLGLGFCLVAGASVALMALLKPG